MNNKLEAIHLNLTLCIVHLMICKLIDKQYYML